MTLNAYLKLWFCFLLLLPLAEASGKELPEEDGLGLEPIEQGRHSEILVAKEVDWTAYDSARLDRPSIEFRKNWIRDQRQRSGITIREGDEKRIKDGLADLFDKVFTKELTRQAGFVMTQDNGPGVIHMTPRIVDLDIIAPDRVRDYIGAALTDSQGRMTVMLEIRDSASGSLLATTRHYLEDWQKGYMEWTTSATNQRAFRLMLERWASDLCERLFEARSESS